jgi:hypothetical protein
LEVLLQEELEASIGNGRVICASTSALYLGERRLDSHSRAVWSVQGHRFDHIRDSDDARLDQDRIALEASRIAASIHALVVL